MGVASTGGYNEYRWGEEWYPLDARMRGCPNVEVRHLWKRRCPNVEEGGHPLVAS